MTVNELLQEAKDLNFEAVIIIGYKDNDIKIKSSNQYNTGIRVKHKLTGIIVTTPLTLGYDSRYWEFLNYIFTEENEI